MSMYIRDKNFGYNLLCKFPWVYEVEAPFFFWETFLPSDKILKWDINIHIKSLCLHKVFARKTIAVNLNTIMQVSWSLSKF